ncbi:hypothetical protein HHK36_001673 [Tetracentron sinense]|uniref:Uncharacterized protein n=1 Tax=Tetracentron sinense TaxID=13715 RepID=A0A834ZUF7_TETSI|nr:hypothetical protein HHK36_001673 [Tetracentron sinense]
MDPPTRSWRIYSRNMKFSDVYRGDDLIVHLKEIHDYQSAFGETKIFKSFRNPPISFFSMSTFVAFKRWVGESEQLQSLAFLLSFHSSLILGASGPSRIISQEPGPLENFPIIPFQRGWRIRAVGELGFSSFISLLLNFRSIWTVPHCLSGTRTVGQLSNYTLSTVDVLKFRKRIACEIMDGVANP